MAKIVLPLRGGPPPEPPYGGLGEEGWARGVTFYELVDRAGDERSTLDSIFDACEIPAEIVAAIGTLAQHVRVLALADPHDTSSCAAIACAERLFTLSPRVWMRIFDAGTCPDLMQRYARGGEPLPVFVFFGGDQHEFARWRPAGDSPEGASHPRPFDGPEARSWVLGALASILGRLSGSR